MQSDLHDFGGSACGIVTSNSRSRCVGLPALPAWYRHDADDDAASQVEPDRLLYALTTRVLEMRGETITTKLTAEQVRGLDPTP